MTTSEIIQIVLAIIGILVTVGLAVASGVGGILCWFVVRFFTATDEKLGMIIEKVDDACSKVTTHAALREGDRRDIDSAHEVICNHAAILGEHSVKLAEHDGHFSSILGKHQNG